MRLTPTTAEPSLPAHTKTQSHRENHLYST
jgi:hypothetical protein